MDDVIKLVEAFAVAEREAIAASLVEPDPAAFREKVEEAQRYFWDAPNATLRLTIGQSSGAGDTEQNRQWAADVKPRQILMVKQFQHPEAGDLYAVYTTPEDPKFAVMYGEILYVARKDGELKIVSRYRKGFPGAGITWEWMGGERIDDPGTPEEVRKLLAPQNPEHKADYDAA